MIRVLVLCAGNSCRSQMAEGFLTKYAGDRAEIHSAGTEALGLNPMAVRVMSEIGMDISHHESMPVEAYEGQNFDWVITVCDVNTEACPVFIGEAKRLHHSFFDPAKVKGTEEDKLQMFREVRDEVAEFAKGFVEENVLINVNE